MTVEKAISWIQLNNFGRWRLYKGEDKVDEFDPEKTEDSPDDAAQRLFQVLELLGPGAYKLKGWNGKSRQAAQSVFAFSVSPVPTQSPVSRSHSDADEIYRKARQDAEAMMRFERRIERLEENYLKIVEEVKEINKLLNDDDDENDEDALDRLSGLAEKLPDLATGFSSLGSMFSKK